MTMNLVNLFQYFNWTQFAIVIQSDYGGVSGGEFCIKIKICENFFLILGCYYFSSDLEVENDQKKIK